MLKVMIRKMLGVLGYEVVRKDAGGFFAPYLSKICSPATVFDVGVADGTTELYRAYPEARFFLVDPVSDFRNAIAGIRARETCRVYAKAAGEKNGRIKINIEKDPALSSVKGRPRADSPVEEKEVDMVSLDSIYAENTNIAAPVLIKIDVEGAELEVLRGAKRLLSITEMVIVEVSISRRFEDSCGFEDVVAFMKENGYRVFDFLTVCRGSVSGGANMADVVFKKSDSLGAVK